MVLDQVEGATIVNSQAMPGTDLFLRVAGANSNGIYLHGNELHAAGAAFKVDDGVASDAVKSANNF